MEFGDQKPIEIIYNKKIEPLRRLSAAISSLDDHKLGPELVLKWIANSIAFDSNFQTEEGAWDLFYRCLCESNNQNNKFSLIMKPNIAILAAFRSPVRDLALLSLKTVQEKFPNAWRPKFDDLISTLKFLLESNEAGLNHISFLLTAISMHRELTVGSEQVFKKVMDLFDPLIDNVEKYDKEQILVFLSRAICGPFLFQKISGKELGNTFDSFVEKLKMPTNSSPIRPAVCDFMHTLMPIYKECAVSSKISNLFSFPMNLYKKANSLDLLVPIIHECRALSLYTPQIAQPGDFETLNRVTDEAIKMEHYDCLAELARLDFRLIRPTLSILLDKANENFAVACLEMAFELRMPQVLFGQNDFFSEPLDGNFEIDTRLDEHISNFSLFVSRYSFLVSLLNSSQTNGILRILACSKKPSDQVFLFWTVKNARFTPEHYEVIEFIIRTAGCNPWRCAAGSIAGYELRLKFRPVITSEIINIHPISLYCLITQKKSNSDASNDSDIILALPKIVSRKSTVPLVPTPSMENTDAYRLGFIIEHITELDQYFTDTNLEKLIRIILTRAVFASSVKPMNTIADYSMRLLSNSHFYENIRIRNAFYNAAIKILNDEDDNKRIMLALIISSLPTEFIASVESNVTDYLHCISIQAYNILVSNYGKQIEVSEFFSDILTQMPKMIVRIASCLPVEFIKLNIDELYSTAPKEISGVLLSRLLSRGDTYINNLSNPTKEAILSICEYCFQKGKALPFTHLYMKDDIECLCAQSKAGHNEATLALLNSVIFNAENAVLIMSSFANIPNIESQCKNIRKKIGLLIREVSKNTDLQDNINAVVREFTSSLPLRESTNYSVTAPEYAMELLKNASPHLQIVVLSSIIADNDVYPNYEEYINKLVEGDMNQEMVKELTALHIGRFFSNEIIEKIFITIIDFTTKAHSINDVCLLCSCVSNMFINCKKSGTLSLLPMEAIRHITNLFFKLIQQLEPSFKMLKTLAKMYASSVRILRPNFLHYLIASYVSNFSSLSLLSSWSDTTQKMLQNCIFPVFQKVSKEQLSEVSIALHETQRQQFQIVYQRWEKTSQFTGKV